MPGATVRFTAATDGKITEMMFITPNWHFQLQGKVGVAMTKNNC